MSSWETELRKLREKKEENIRQQQELKKEENKLQAQIEKILLERIAEVEKENSTVRSNLATGDYLFNNFLYKAFFSLKCFRFVYLLGFS